MEFEKQIGDYAIYTGERPFTNTEEIIRESGAMRIQNGLGLIREKEFSGAMLERNRRKAINGLRAIIEYVFEEYGLPKSNGVDFGCETTGGIVEKLLPANINIESYNKIQELGLNERLDMATGLSFLGNTHSIENTISQIASTLKPGGYFFHFQDVQPGFNGVMDQVKFMKSETKPNMEFGGDRLMTIETPEGYIPLIELFRKRLDRAIGKEKTLEVLSNQYVTARNDLSSNNGTLYYADMLLSNLDYQEASGVVTIAKKI